MAANQIITFNTNDYGPVEINLSTNKVYFKRDDYETDFNSKDGTFIGHWGNKFWMNEYPKHPFVKTPQLRFILQEIRPVTIGEIRV